MSYIYYISKDGTELFNEVDLEGAQDIMENFGLDINNYVEVTKEEYEEKLAEIKKRRLARKTK